MIIYDVDVQARIPIQRVWENLGVADIVNNQMVEFDRLPQELK